MKSLRPIRRLILEELTTKRKFDITAIQHFKNWKLQSSKLKPE
jgi:hypothetical protein